MLRLQFRFLFFRPVRPDLDGRFADWLVYIVIVSWLAGVGRYWDHPDAAAWQYAGLGSQVYVFVLAGFLYGVVRPLRPARWRYREVLVFVGLTALPGWLYAVPVERFLPLETAQAMNAGFLALVAAWRVALYVRFLYAGAGLDAFRTAVATVLPLSAIVVVLAILNLEHVVFDLMSGIREGAETANDLAYSVVVTLSVFAYLAFPVTLIAYLVAIFWRRAKIRGPDRGELRK
ncbi:MAG: hypothetical protein KJO33_11115 [Gammaproteobacteria bacterium]|nr:hypothetical protein [Gammaproteobacteria bacterium]